MGSSEKQILGIATWQFTPARDTNPRFRHVFKPRKKEGKKGKVTERSELMSHIETAVVVAEKKCERHEKWV